MTLALEAVRLKGARLHVVDVAYETLEGGSCGGVFFHVTSGLNADTPTTMVTSLQEVQGTPYDTANYQDLSCTVWNAQAPSFVDGEYSDFMQRAVDTVR